MDFSPCKVKKLKLHSRMETYLNASGLELRKKWELKDGIQMIKSVFQVAGLRTVPRARKIESYKPSSSVYKKLNAKIYVKNLEFLKEFSGSPVNKEKLRANW
jgi:hypothetical protein